MIRTLRHWFYVLFLIPDGLERPIYCFGRCVYLDGRGAR